MANAELKKRSDFENNQDIIGAAFFKLISTNGKMPTLSKLAAATNLSTKTIDRHLKAESFKEMKGKLRAFNDMMLVQFAQKVSKSSNPGMWDMYWLLTEDEYAKTKNKSNVAVTVTGFSGDCTKYNEAAKLGWMVLRYTVLTYKNLSSDLHQILNHKII